MEVTIIFPVLNERLRLEKGIDRTVEYIRQQMKIPCRLMIIDNGSTDETPQIAEKLCEKYREVSYVRITKRGVGAAFRKGIALNQSEIVGYMDIDLSTDIKHLGQAIHLFEVCPELDYINGTRFSKDSNTRGRKWYRRITSQGLLWLLQAVFRMKCTDAVCGFTFVRAKTARRLASACSKENGWFYTIEFLLRAERMGFRILDLPVDWQEDYDTTVRIWKTVKNYLIQIIKLRKRFWEEDRLAADKGTKRKDGKKQGF